MFKQPSPTGSVIDPSAPEPFAPPTPGKTPQGSPVALTSQRMYIPPKEKKTNLLAVTLLIIMVLVSAVLGYFLFTTSVELHNMKTDEEARVDSLIAMAVTENTTKLEQEFAEREKYPYRSFMGPVDYGSVSFQYPQTWSVYIARDAANGGMFEAYLNPLEVGPLGASAINALRVVIRTDSFESVIASYTTLVNIGQISFSTRNVGGGLANVYTGRLSGSIFGSVAIFKIRDKTVILQTDAELFFSDFNKILDTVTFIQ